MTDRKTGKQPTHDLCVTNKQGREGFQVIGVGWEGENGKIGIKLNKMVNLSWRDDDYALYLFPRRDK